VQRVRVGADGGHRLAVVQEPIDGSGRKRRLGQWRMGKHGHAACVDERRHDGSVPIHVLSKPSLMLLLRFTSRFTSALHFALHFCASLRASHSFVYASL
jgi:hypothetical protein